MAYPTKYTRQYDYVAYQNANPNRPLPAGKINADLNAAQISSGQIVDFLSRVVRSDGALANGSVGYDQLSPSLQTAGLAPALPWMTATKYALGASVISDYGMYRALVAHTSEVFATDLAGGKWVFVAAVITGSAVAPTATVGLTATAGTANTAMRSDAAPALDQTIAPTWTGVHSFTESIKFTGNTPSAGPSVWGYQNGVLLGLAGGSSGTRFYDQTAGTTLVEIAPSGNLNITQGLLTQQNSGPAWSTYALGNYSGHHVALNGFPDSAEYSPSSERVAVNAIAGANEIPASAIGHGQGTGGAFYARTGSATMGAVGVFGQGAISADGVGAWGGNFITTNGPTVNATMASHDFYVLPGVEIDVNIWRKSGGAAPSGNSYGLLMLGASEVQPTGDFTCMFIGTPGINVSPDVLQWKKGIEISDGSVEDAIIIGTTRSTNFNSLGSAPLKFRTRTGGGTNVYASIATDSSGNLNINPVSSALVVLGDGTGGTMLNASVSTEVQIPRATQSTSTTTGALKIAGGIGVVKNAYIGGVVTVGVAGSALGTLALSGNTSGATTLRPAAAASGTLTLPAATDTLVGKATTDTLTNKTLTAPVINSPTGIAKSDVGLGNVDNTSDATKNAASATLTTKTIDTAANTVKINGTTVTTVADFQGALAAGALAFKLSAANFNSTADQAITITLPTGFTRYRFQAVNISNPSIPLTTAVGGLYTAAAKGGIAVVAASQVYSGLTTNTAGASGSMLIPTVTNGTTAFYNSTTLYLSLTTPQGAAATADVTIIIQPLP